MPSSDFAAEPTDASERRPEDLAEAGRYRTAREGFDHGLVVLALGESYWLLPKEDGYSLAVEPSVGPWIRDQLARHDRENADWPPRLPEDQSAGAVDLLTPLCWALVLVGVFRLQQLHPAWTDAGLLDRAALLEHGEWWRPLTALFLHADASHLASNLLSGVLVFAAVTTTFGRLRGWLLVLVSGVLGNIAVALAHQGEPYRSLGASTAIFAAVGLLTGRAVRVAARGRHPHRWRSFFVPLATGLTVLGLHGAGGVQVDVMAHVAGFLAGGAAGFATTAGRGAAPARP